MYESFEAFILNIKLLSLRKAVDVLLGGSYFGGGWYLYLLKKLSSKAIARVHGWIVCRS
jgi:hypothetical protein